jgi:hypothetical protein
LWNPGESLGKEAIRPVKINDAVSESVTDSPGSSEEVFDPLMPSLDSRVKTEPGLAERINFSSSPAQGRLESPHAASIVSTVHSAFTLIAPAKFSSNSLWLIALAPDALPVEVVDVDPVEEGPLEGWLIRLPRNHLGVGPREVHVQQDVAGVWQERPTDVWQWSHARVPLPTGKCNWPRSPRGKLP